MASKLFEFAILHHTRPTKAEQDAGERSVTTIVVEPKRVLAHDEGKALLLAAREIPETYLDGRLDEIEVLIRPF